MSLRLVLFEDIRQHAVPSGQLQAANSLFEQLFEPLGLYGRWLKVRTFFTIFPFYRKGMFKRQKSFQKSDRLR